MSALPIRARSTSPTSTSLAGSPPSLAGSPSTAAAAIDARLLRGHDLRVLDPARLGLWFFLGTVIMLFAAFSSAYLVRMASGAWSAIDLPGVLWISTTILVASSATLEMARQRLGSTAARWVGATLALGVLFLAGQAAAWRALQLAGVFLPESPHAAFLYIFTALHGAHLAGGLIWLAVVWRSVAGARRTAFVGSAAPSAVAGGTKASASDRAPFLAGSALDDRLARCATYWHFMGGLWVYLFAVLHLR